MSGGSGTEDGRGRRRRRSRRNRNRSSSERYGRGRSGKGSSSKEAGGKRDRGRQRRKSQAHSNGPTSAPSNSPCLGASRYFTGELNEFELFCAYHLGIHQDGSFRPPSLSEVARRFKTDDAAVREALQEYRMDLERVRASGFDIGLAKLDIEVAPAGIDRVELARTIFQDFLDAGCGVGPVPEISTANGSPNKATPSGSDVD